jgi:2,3-bisphosphoglycerate-independent phosphoglycerate mutase
MKYVIIIPDGSADEGQVELEGRTPLEAAHTPAMDDVVRRGVIGRANHTPVQFEAGSAVANMSLLGYDPIANYTGRAPMEAAAQGLQLHNSDWCVRCNLVTVEQQQMKSFTAGHISSQEARLLLQTAQQQLADQFDYQLEFHPGVSYRNLLTVRPREGQEEPFSLDTRTTPPHDLSDRSIENDFPRGPGSELLCRLMQSSLDWFGDHPVNQARVASGKLPATNIWLWGLGKRPALPAFADLHRIQGAMITAVDLLRGIAALIGWDRIEVPGATGYVDTDYAAKGSFAIEALRDYDLVCVHIEAPDESSHEGDLRKKLVSLERIDQSIVGPILEHLDRSGEPYRILISPDHPTFLSTKTHTHGDVPFAICGRGIAPDNFHQYHERNAQQSELYYPQGWHLLPWFLRS